MAKRDVLNLHTLLVGFFLAFLYTFLQIYIELKVGFVVVTGMEILGFILLSLFGKYDPKDNVIVITITTASVLVNIGVLVAFPAISMFSHLARIPEVEITMPLIFTMIALTGFTGLFLLEPAKEAFMDEPWPQIEAQVQNIISLSEGNVQTKRNMMIGLLGAGAYMGTIIGLSQMTKYDLRTIPHGVGVTEVPPYIGISNSPMLVGIGFFAGFRRTLLIFIGSLFSMLVWFLLERDPHILFGEHVTRPEIFYTAIGIVGTTIALDAWSAYKESKTVSLEEEEREAVEVFFSKENLFLFLKQWKCSLLSLILFYVISVFLFSISGFFFPITIPPLLLLIGLPLVLISAFFVARAASETGMVVGFITDALAVPAILFFSINFPSVILFMTLMAAVQSAAVTLLGRYVLGRRLKVHDETIRKSAITGTIFGTIIGTWLIYIFSKPPFGFGTHEFPAPTAQLMGFTVLSLMKLTTFSLPFADEFGIPYLIGFLSLGIAASIALHKRNISPITLAVGLLIPPAYSIPLLLGGLISKYVQNRTEEIINKYKQILGGVVAGEGLIIALHVLWIASIDFIF
ncbi:MAG: OPT/YSL family transporter [Candidatus Asgardarchaeia archaeon]